MQIRRSASGRNLEVETMAVTAFIKSGAQALISKPATLLLINLLIIAVASSSLAQRRDTSRKAATHVEWYRFTGPDGDFSLAFPAKPEPFESDAEGPVTMIRTYHLSTKDGQYFSVNFQDLGGDPLSRDGNEFGPNDENKVAVAARERGERVIQVHRLAKNVIDMEVWQPVKDSTDKLHRWDHAILHRARLYTLGCGSLINNKQVDKAVCRKFFSSIRFVK
jgi:hypothetical protein